MKARSHPRAKSNCWTDYGRQTKSLINSTEHQVHGESGQFTWVNSVKIRDTWWIPVALDRLTHIGSQNTENPWPRFSQTPSSSWDSAGPSHSMESSGYSSDFVLSEKPFKSHRNVWLLGTLYLSVSSVPTGDASEATLCSLNPLFNIADHAPVPITWT